MPTPGLKDRDVVVGTGARRSSSTATVRVNYEGRLPNGFRFDGNNRSQFGLNRLIAGWTEGLASMRVGGIRQLVIPANPADGSTARTGIPANSTTVFDVELLSTTCSWLTKRPRGPGWRRGGTLPPRR